MLAKIELSWVVQRAIPDSDQVFIIALSASGESSKFSAISAPGTGYRSARNRPRALSDLVDLGRFSRLLDDSRQ
jgi:hypothetical protein